MTEKKTAKKAKSKAEITEHPPKKRGRPSTKEKVVVPFVDAAIAGLKIEEVPLEKIDLEDTSFRFRVNLRVSDLAKSLAANGQQQPIILRPKSDGRYQIVSGFRRLGAIQKLGEKWTSVKAVVRTDLKNNAEAAKVHILENEARQTYNDLDRAYAILAYRKLGKNSAEIEEIFQVGTRQRQRLEELTTFPKSLQEAVADDKVSSTNALRLMQHARKNPGTSVAKWITWMDNNSASYTQFNKALLKEVTARSEEAPIELYVENVKKGKKTLRIRPIALGEGITAKQKQGLLSDLRAVVKFVEGL